MPVATIEGERLEHSYLKQEKIFFAVLNQAAVAANASHVWVLNPTASKVISVVTAAWVDNGGGVLTRLSMGMAITAATITAIIGGGQGIANARDGRWPNVPGQVTSPPVTQIWSFATGAGLSFSESWSSLITAAQALYVPGPLAVLSPGTALGFANNTVNQALRVSVLGYERPMSPEEAAVG